MIVAGLNLKRVDGIFVSARPPPVSLNSGGTSFVGLCTKSRRNISDSHSPICNPQQRYAITVSDKPKESLRILPIFVQYRGLRVADLGLRTETRFRLFVQSREEGNVDVTLGLFLDWFSLM